MRTARASRAGTGIPQPQVGIRQSGNPGQSGSRGSPTVREARGPARRTATRDPFKLRSAKGQLDRHSGPAGPNSARPASPAVDLSRLDQTSPTRGLPGSTGTPACLPRLIGSGQVHSAYPTRDPRLDQAEFPSPDPAWLQGPPSVWNVVWAAGQSG